MSNSPPSSIFRQYKIRHAAEDGMLIICYCAFCRRQSVFWAEDLVATGDGDTDVRQFGRWCSNCGKSEYTRTRHHLPLSGDIARLEVWRPSGIAQKQLWTKEWLDLPRPALKDDAVLAKPPDRRRRY